MEKKVIKKPELLAPAGSTDALDAAIAAGADAVYFGASAFNARMNAANFDRENIERAISKCRNYGVRSNITFNTLIYDREIKAALEEVEFLYKCGADALIVADIGLAREIKRRFPDIELHASTQMSVHNTEGAKFAAEQGFCRAVVARELNRDSIKYLCENSPIETEIFIHGALCVSHSGQCLFSSLVGGRSGNRGECAQPCRLPYSGSYPLSLKDNCLASDMEELLSLGAASFKIEGRMKSPAYVYGVTSIYRRLIDEGRNATDKEIAELASLFSRSGFTSGYFHKQINEKMNGIRTENDKAQTVNETDYDIKARRKTLDAQAKIKLGEPSLLTLTADVSGKTVSACVTGFTPEKAVNAPATEESLKKNLLKFGATDFVCDDEHIKIELDAGVMMPVSAINALRRDAVAAFETALKPVRTVVECDLEKPVNDGKTGRKSARFMTASQISEEAKAFFDIIYLPLEAYDPERANGVILPAVIFDREAEKVRNELKKCREMGAVHALVGNVGHISLAKELGYVCHGDFRLNVTNSYSAALYKSLGFDGVIASPELSLAKLRDLGVFASDEAIIYGRIPLMLLEKCVIKQTSGCESCRSGAATLKDRLGEVFPVYREGEHRNILYNSRVTYMLDKKKELSDCGVDGGHFILTNEKNINGVIRAYKNGEDPDSAVRRIPRK